MLAKNDLGYLHGVGRPVWVLKGIEWRRKEEYP
jgi:hypothetical protein